MAFRFTYQNSDKISLRDLKTTQSIHSDVKWNYSTIPKLPIHISWQEESDLCNWENPRLNKSNSMSKRRKIFDQNSPKNIKNNSKVENKQSNLAVDRKDGLVTFKVLQMEDSPIKSQQKTETNPSNSEVDKMINEINRKLEIHRKEISQSHRSNQPDIEYVKLEQAKLKQLEQIEHKIEENNRILIAQGNVLKIKIPEIQKIALSNDTEIKEIKELLKEKLKEDKRKEIQTQSILKNKELLIGSKNAQISKLSRKIDSTEQAKFDKQYEVMKCKLELERIRRVEQLQKSNLELYNNLLQEQPCTSHYYMGYKQLSDYIDQNSESCCQCNQEQVGRQISAIMVKNGSDYGSYSPNNTIGELLSPFALQQNNDF